VGAVGRGFFQSLTVDWTDDKIGLLIALYEKIPVLERFKKIEIIKTKNVFSKKSAKNWENS